MLKLNLSHRLVTVVCFVFALGFFASCQELPELYYGTEGTDQGDTSQTEFETDTTETKSLVDTEDDSASESCDPQMWTTCNEGDIYWLDSCHNLGGVKTECTGNYTCDYDIDETAVCICANSWTGNNCETCPGNWNEASSCSTCKPGWAGDNCETCVRYVEADQSGDSLTWATATGNIQDAIGAAAEAVVNDETVDVCQVWVKTGTYYIYENSVNDSIHLNAGVELLGGFTGDEKDAEDRLKMNFDKTILSGRQTDSSEEKVEHVVRVVNDVVIDGFRITSGFTPMIGSIDKAVQNGAGLLIEDASPILKNITFEANHAVEGGAVAVLGGAPQFENCNFYNNSSIFSGAAIYAYQATSITVDNCAFNANIAHNPAGGFAFGTAMYTDQTAEVSCTGCVFTNNVGYTVSSIQTANTSQVNISNSVFSGNNSTAPNATMGYVLDVKPQSGQSVNLTLNNCTIADNTFGGTTPDAANLLNGSDLNLTITNSIIWNNANATQCIAGTTTADISYTDQDCTDISDTDNGNLNQDPLFTSTYELNAGSPCIDSADGSVAPELDNLGHNRVNGSTGEVDTDGLFVDMGAYEYQPQ